MKLTFNVKSLGKKRPYISNNIIDLNVEPEISLKGLLEKLVLHQVNEFNERKSEKNLYSFLSESSIQKSSSTGKIDFNENYNTEKADSAEAVSVVFQAFKDGLIALFINDNQIENLDQNIYINESDSLTIVKLTFLAGSIW